MNSNRTGILPKAERATGKIMRLLALVLAVLGGLLLTAIAAMTVVSVTGRYFTFVGLRPITGDYEMLQMGAAISICSFLPWCQLMRGHVTVDVFVGIGPDWLQRATQLAGDTVIAAIAAVLLWRFWLGMGEMIANGQESYLLGLPIWYGYVGGVVGMILFLLVTLYTVWRDINDLMTGEESPA